MVEIVNKGDINLTEEAKSQTLVNFVPVQIEVLRSPGPTLHNPAGGFNLLSKLPSGPIVPAQFVHGARAKFERTLAQVPSLLPLVSRVTSST